MNTKTYSKYSNIYMKSITGRLDRLEEILTSGEHLIDPEEALYLCEKLGHWWHNMLDNERDFVSCARIAIREQKKWNTP